jgi:hypothetical protein
MNYWGKGKVTMEKGFDNGGVKMRLSSVNLGSLESSRGTSLLERRILRWWSF